MDDVRNLIARYCTAVAEFDRELFASCWTPDARWIAKGVTIEGIDRIAKVFVRAREKFPLCVQAALATAIEPAGDGGVRARTQVHEIQWVAGAAVGVELYGTYSDHCVEHDGRWCFAERSFTELYRGPRPLPGVLARPRP